VLRLRLTHLRLIVLVRYPVANAPYVILCSMTNLVVSTIAAIWIVLIALLSVQNASLVSLRFVFWRSIDLPWGLVLAGAVALGFLIGGCIPLLGGNSTTIKRR
jgi:lipopolysaccharide assembly protein A